MIIAPRRLIAIARPTLTELWVEDDLPTRTASSHPGRRALPPPALVLAGALLAVELGADLIQRIVVEAAAHERLLRAPRRRSASQADASSGWSIPSPVCSPLPPVVARTTG